MGHPDRNIDLRIVILIDNPATGGLLPEHGFSLWIDLGEQRILFDTVQGPYEDTGGPFYLDPSGRRHDPIADDLALWIRARRGLAVCQGCGHAGLINTLPASF
jgi:metal-dependent hydrolase (beta-lactamase superfamily II)